MKYVALLSALLFIALFGSCGKKTDQGDMKYSVSTDVKKLTLDSARSEAIINISTYHIAGPKEPVTISVGSLPPGVKCETGVMNAVPPVTYGAKILTRNATPGDYVIEIKATTPEQVQTLEVPIHISGWKEMGCQSLYTGSYAGFHNGYDTNYNFLLCQVEATGWNTVRFTGCHPGSFTGNIDCDTKTINIHRQQAESGEYVEGTAVLWDYNYYRPALHLKLTISNANGTETGKVELDIVK